MRIAFPKDFDNFFERELHITKKDVIRTVTNPLKKQTIVMGGLRVLLFLQKEADQKTYLLVTGKCQDETFLLRECFRLLPELVLKTGNEEPIMLLEQLAFNFGIPMKIGNSVKKFFFREIITVPKGAKSSDIVEMDIPKNSDVLQSFFLHYSKEESIVECIMAFNIELTSYLTWLNHNANVQVRTPDYDVFISYKRNTAKDFALSLKECLTEEGYRTFLDLTDIPKEFEGTEKWFDIRDKAIKNSKRFLLIITIRIETSKEVAKELSLARNMQNMKFMYLRHEMLEPQISLKFNDEVIDLSEGNQEQFGTTIDLNRKVLKILQDSKT